MKTKIITILLIPVLIFHTLIFYTPAGAAQFPDVVKGSWYENAVLSLVNKGIVHGFPDGTFKPEQDIKYDEFIKLLVTSMGYVPKDMPGYWAAQYIEEAKKRGYLYDNEVSDHKRDINRGEMARLLSRAIGNEDPTLLGGYQKNMADYESIDEKYRDHALICYKTGLMNGIDGSFEPYFVVTRKEACVIINRLTEPDMRVTNTPLGSIDGLVTTKDLTEDLKSLGFLVKDGYEDILLSRQVAYQIIYDTILNNEALRHRFVPISVDNIMPVVFTHDDFHMSEAFARVIDTTRSISQNLASMQLFEIKKTYEDGRSTSMLNYNVLSDSNALIKVERSIDGFREISKESHRMPYDHTRFGEIFADSDMIEDKYKEALYMLYDLGLIDSYSLSEYSYSFYCSPKTYISRSEKTDILLRLRGEMPLNVLDEKHFGAGDSWGVEKFGNKNYTIRLSEMITVYIYDIIDSLGATMQSITPGDKGYVVYLATFEYPYYDDFFLILDDCPPGGYNNKESTSIKIFLQYEIHKYKNLVPAGYAKMIEADLFAFLDDKDKQVLLKNYGGMTFGISKMGSDRVTFWYAFGEG